LFLFIVEERKSNSILSTFGKGGAKRIKKQYVQMVFDPPLLDAFGYTFPKGGLSLISYFVTHFFTSTFQKSRAKPVDLATPFPKV